MRGKSLMKIKCQGAYSTKLDWSVFAFTLQNWAMFVKCQFDLPIQKRIQNSKHTVRERERSGCSFFQSLLLFLIENPNFWPSWKLSKGGSWRLDLSPETIGWATGPDQMQYPSHFGYQAWPGSLPTFWSRMKDGGWGFTRFMSHFRRVKVGEKKLLIVGKKAGKSSKLPTPQFGLIPCKCAARSSSNFASTLYATAASICKIFAVV